MLFKEFVESPKTVSVYEEFLLPLKRLHVYAIFLDLAVEKLTEMHTLKYDAAARANWHSGYTEALRDIFQFSEQYGSDKKQTIMPHADFGSIDDLFKKGEITEDERNQLRNEHTNFYKSKG